MEHGNFFTLKDRGFLEAGSLKSGVAVLDIYPRLAQWRSRDTGENPHHNNIFPMNCQDQGGLDFVEARSEKGNLTSHTSPRLGFDIVDVFSFFVPFLKPSF